MGTYVKHDFVQKLQNVAAEHVRHQAPIDLAAQCFEIDIPDLIPVALEIYNRIVLRNHPWHCRLLFAHFVRVLENRME